MKANEHMMTRLIVPNRLERRFGEGRRHRLVRGQRTIETALLLGAVTIALIVFFTFIRSAISSRIKIGSDAFGHGLLHNGK